MNQLLKARMTQVAGLLLLTAWWLTLAQPASARTIPGPDSGAGSTIGPDAAPATIVVHGHTSFWVYAGVAVIAVVVTLVAVGVARWARQIGTPRQKALTA